MILIAITSALLLACGKTQAPLDESRLQILNRPIEVDMTGVAGYTGQSTGEVQSQGLFDTLLSLTPSLNLIGTIAPPQISGSTLQATDVFVNGTKAYVAYNTAGVEQAGGVDVIDFANSGSPVLKSSAVYSDTDINKVFVESGKLYATGSTSSGETGAILKRISLDGSGLLTSFVESKVLRSAADADIPAHTGTSVLKAGNYVYAATGKNGGLNVLNASDLSQVAFTAVEDARDLATDSSGKILVLTGKTSTKEALVQTYAAVTGTAVSGTAITLPGAAIDEGKSTIVGGTIGHIASAGQGGARFVCGTTGSMFGNYLGMMGVPVLPSVEVGETAANSVAFGNGLVYVAQGGAGVYIYSIERTLLTFGCAGLSLNYRGKFTFGPRVSVNNVYYSNGYLVVATGLGGFQIIQVTQSLLAGLLQIL